MDHPYDTRFFLGANAPGGFYSLFDELQKPDLKHVYILKGGPGNGKSSFIRRIADAMESSGISVEYIFCASDPHSLDGLLIPSLGIAYVDGTAPHVMEPSLPAVLESYVDLGQFWDLEGIKSRGEELRALFPVYKKYHVAAAQYIAAAGRVDDLLFDLGIAGASLRKLERRARGLIKKELPRPGSYTASPKLRFLSGITPQGPTCFYDTVRALCPKVYELADQFGLAHFVLSRILDAALAAGLEVYACRSPFKPQSQLEHVLIVPLGLAFVTSNPLHAYPFTPFRRIVLDHVVDSGLRRAHGPRIRGNKKLLRQLVGLAAEQLQEANACHAEIEAIYNPYVDFTALRALADTHIQRLRAAAKTAAAENT